MILAMLDVAGLTVLVSYMLLIYVAALLMIAAIVTAIIFSVKAAKSKNKREEPTQENNAYAEAPASAPPTDESPD